MPSKTEEKELTRESNKTGHVYYFLIILTILTLWTRFHNIHNPPWVCWDETHFGKMGSWYINRTFFFDVHPPLGKMLIGGVGYMTGYNGTFPFEKPGDLYHDHNYLGMRIACTFLGACLVPFSYLTVWEFTHSITASKVAGALVLFDVGMITLNQYILLDPILLFFISGATFAMAKFRNLNQEEFSSKWWTWLLITGVFLGCAFSVKFVGLFVILLVGVHTISELWIILGDLSQTIKHTIKHFLARALCLIAVPVVLYIAFFFIHLSVLYKSGNGDGHFSSLFQTALEGNQLHNASMPRDLAYGAVITLKNSRVGGGYLHSHFHLYPEGVGARQQQVTAYAHKDDNNKFLIKKWNEDPPLPYTEDWNNAEVELIKHGDLVRLEHVITRRNIHSHQQPAPMSKKQFQITGYGENGTGDANDVWRVELIGGSDGEVVQTVTSKIKFHHYFMKCVLTCSGKTLPKWAYEQQEIACNPTSRDPNAMWNVEDNFYPKLPNVSFQNFAPGFVSRFIESHRVMLQGNAGLKPKEGEYTSRPWEWPINIRGQFFSGNDQRIYLLGNPIIWWGNLIFLALFLVLYLAQSIKEQRGSAESSPIIAERKQKTLNSCIWLFTGWALHYIPFWAMGRVLYFHHYFPAQLYASMMTGVIFDFIITTVSEMLPDHVGKSFFHTMLGGYLAILWYSFYYFSPLAYGMGETPATMKNSTVHYMKWLDSWEF